MTEDQIERLVEKQFDQIDARLMAGKLTQADYDAEAAEIYLWAEEQYALRSPQNRLEDAVFGSFAP